MARSTIQSHLKKKPDASKPRSGGRVNGTAPRKAEGRRFLLTSAQNNTRVSPVLWKNLEALAKARGATIMVGTFSYNKNAYGPMWVKADTFVGESEEQWFDPLVTPHIVDERVELAPGLVWCGDMNILPTAVHPLQGMQNFNGKISNIFPHAKLAMESVATGQDEPAKFNYTTGAATMINYIRKRAGLRAEFHHVYGALLVEVDEDGTWFVRQVNADRRWRLYDLELLVEDGVAKQSNDTVQAITWGDIHARYIDPDVATCWEPGGMLDQLRPSQQFFHDVLDFRARNHHERKDPHKRFRRYVEGYDSVWKELQHTAEFLKFASRPWCKGVVVNSNHDRAMERWLKEEDYRQDPVNAEFHLEAQAEWYRAIRAGEQRFVLLEWALRRAGAPREVRFLGRKEPTYLLGIRVDLHGDEGPRGAKGTIYNLARTGEKITMADKHAAAIFEGVFVAGTSSLLDLEYNTGPSDWSHSHVLTYKNGKRAIITMRGVRWRGRN